MIMCIASQTKGKSYQEAYCSTDHICQFPRNAHAEQGNADLPGASLLPGSLTPDQHLQGGPTTIIQQEIRTICPALSFLEEGQDKNSDTVILVQDLHCPIFPRSNLYFCTPSLPIPTLILNPVFLTSAATLLLLRSAHYTHLYHW